MSSCLIIQQENKCYIGSDTAVSCVFGEKRVRIGNDSKKTFVHNDKIIFCSGNMELYTKVVNEIKSNNKLNIDIFIEYLKCEYDKSIKSCNFELFMCEYKNKKVQTTQLSSYNNFEPIVRIVPKGQVGVFAMGYNTDEVFNDAIENIKKSKDISKIYLNTFNKNICNEIGGSLNLFEMDRDLIKEYKYELEDNTPTFLEKFNNTASFIMAKLLVGSVILGEKLYITSENGEFYIGNMDEKQGFGLSIKDSIEAGQKQRIFLGTEVDSDGVRRAKLRLTSKDGKSVVLDENGIVSEYQYSDRSHVDSNAPMYSYLRIQDNVSSFKECILNIVFKPFRVYNLGLDAGGTVISKGYTSLSGGSSTSGGGGYYYGVETSTNQNYVNFVSEFATNLTDVGQELNHHHVIPKFQFEHNHNITLYYPNHTHSTPNHQHTTNVSIDTTHNHTQKYGCIDLSGSENVPSNCSLYVNGTLVRGGINSNLEIDIKNYLKKNELNEIKITSTTKGVIHLHLYNRAFVLW